MDPTNESPRRVGVLAHGPSSSSGCLAAPRPGQRVPGLGPSGPERTEGPRRLREPAGYHLASILALMGESRRFRAALRPAPWWRGVAHDDLARQAGRGGQPRTRTGSEPRRARNLESTTVAPLDLESLRPGAPPRLARPLAGGYEARAVPVYVGVPISIPRESEASPPSGTVSFGQSPPRHHSYAKLARAISAPSSPNVA
jgi:hypothetical protein